MEITITLQLSWNATTSYMNPTVILHTHARIGTNSLFANTTWTFFRIFNLTLVQLTSHYLLFSVFTSWPFISIPLFHLLNFTAAKPLFLQTAHNHQHQVVPWTSLFWFLNASRTITNSTNSRGLRTGPWCTPTLTIKPSLPFTFTLIVVSSYIAFFTVTITPSTSRYLGAHQRYSRYPITRSRGTSHTLSPYIHTIHPQIFLLC